MASAIFEFRERVVDFVRTNVPELREIDWYDGLFDRDDIRDWSLRTPCAFVAVTNAVESPYETGEVTVPVEMVMVVICSDRARPRDADQACWEIIEKAGLLFRLQKFGDPHAGPAHDVKFKRLKDPVMRRESVAIGVVQWTTNLTFGRNMAAERDYIYDVYGNRILKTPTQLQGTVTLSGENGRLIVSEPDTTPIKPPRLFRDTPWDEPS